MPLLCVYTAYIHVDVFIYVYLCTYVCVCVCVIVSHFAQTRPLLQPTFASMEYVMEIDAMYSLLFVQPGHDAVSPCPCNNISFVLVED